MKPRVLVVQCDGESGLGALELPLRDAGCALPWWLVPRDDAPPLDVPEADGVVVLGGRASPMGPEPWLPVVRELLADALAADVPALGVCLGGELLAQVVGGSATEDPPTEQGWHRMAVAPEAAQDPLFAGLEDGVHLFEWHYAGIRVPAEAQVLAETPGVHQAFRAPGGARAWGTQFHLEVTLSTIALWLANGGDQLVARDIDVEALREESARRIRASKAFATDVAQRFAAVCGADVAAPSGVAAR